MIITGHSVVREIAVVAMDEDFKSSNQPGSNDEDPYQRQQPPLIHHSEDSQVNDSNASPPPAPVLHGGASTEPVAGPARQIAPPRRTDHTYHDYATQSPSPYEFPVTKKSTSNFPAKLHRMISDPSNSQAIQWQPHGRAWKVLDKELLVEVVIPKYFVQTKYESFTRQLSGWGFKRLHQTGPDYRCYYHECFLRGLPHLTRMMRRAEPNQGKLLPHVEAEPNFYDMDLRHPLPPSTAYAQPPPMGYQAAAAGAYPYGHAANWPPNPYPYGHYPGHGPPPPPANYPPPPYDPYAYGYPPQQHPQQMYPPQGQERMAPQPYGMPPQPHPAYAQPQAGYANPNAYNMYPPNQNPHQHQNPNNYPHPDEQQGRGNAQENDNNLDLDNRPHPGY